MRRILLMIIWCYYSPVSYSQVLEAEGSFRLGDSGETTPPAGTLRWTGQDFEGYDGQLWQSLTGQSTISNFVNGLLTDIDGNVYRTVTIAGGIWMAENLRTTRFNDGRDIPHLPNNAVWTQTMTEKYPGYCWINNSEDYKYPYGALYNWYAADNINVCPSGWHVPTRQEWFDLRDALGGSQTAGGLLKGTGTLQGQDGLWESPNTAATNSTGFTAVSGGSRTSQGNFLWFGQNAYWWTASESNPNTLAYTIWLDYNSGDFLWSDFNKDVGFSIRCKKN